jgi:hypothetical protein
MTVNPASLFLTVAFSTSEKMEVRIIMSSRIVHVARDWIEILTLS